MHDLMQTYIILHLVILADDTITGEDALTTLLRLL